MAAPDRWDLEGTWTVLATVAPTSGLCVAPIGYEVHAGSLLAGIDSEGRRHLLIPLSPGEAARTSTKGRAVHLARLAHDGEQYLTVFCLLPELHGVFTQFCRELAVSVEGVASPARAAAEAFDRWKYLFSEAAMHGRLSEQALIGILGELLTVEELLRRGARTDLSYWVGPFHHVHDLRTLTHALEVKTTLTREGRVVPIASVDQLNEPDGAELRLRHTRLEHEPLGFDLDSLVRRALEAGAQYGELARRLNEVGVRINELDMYRDKKYRIVETRMYDVSGEAFPRIVRSSFTGGDLPAGILRLNYSIDLTNEPPYPMSPTESRAYLDRFASETTDEVDS